MTPRPPFIQTPCVPLPFHHYHHPPPYQIATAAQLLRFSNYLSGFIPYEQVDYSALRVVVGWIQDALKIAPFGFEGIVALVERLGSLVRLSSGRGFYDIWTTFLTDVTPSTNGQSLEILGGASLIGRNAGKETFFCMHTEHYLHSSDLRGQALQFAALCTLPAALSDHEVGIVRDLKGKFQKVCCFRCPPSLGIKVPCSS